MNEPELRALVRETIARHLGAGARATTGASALEGGRLLRQHSSHAMFVLPAGFDGDGPCLIEPAVPCNHCGYCKSYGH
jgi:hypothetical protein